MRIYWDKKGYVWHLVQVEAVDVARSKITSLELVRVCRYGVVKWRVVGN